MKKVLSLILTVVLLLGTLGTAAFAVGYDRPFYSGALGSQTFRIPALYTLSDGSVIAVADKRYASGLDSPANIDIGYAVSPDGYTDWSYGTLNSFQDYADGTVSTKSASFIDSAIVQSSTGRIFVISDAFPSGCGSSQAKKGTGFAFIDGAKRMLLTDGSARAGLGKFRYYIGDFEGSLAPVYTTDTLEKTPYSVDREYNLYKNSEALFTLQKENEDILVPQNVYYTGSELHCYFTSYIWLRYSDDGGKTWSHPVNISAYVKADNEKFLGVCPGRGIVTSSESNQRIIFCVYDNHGGKHNVSTVYSDDNGVTWQRGEETKIKTRLGKTNESQIVDLGGGILRMFSRNTTNYIAFADSTDAGRTWSKFSADTDLLAEGTCMCSFINTSRVIDGKRVVLGAYPSDFTQRADGIIRVGLIDEGKDIEWISAYNVTDGFYAYSCLAELSDGNIALLYEDEVYSINYMVLSLDDEGNISEINGNNVQLSEKTVWEKIAAFLNEAITRLLVILNMI